MFSMYACFHVMIVGAEIIISISCFFSTCIHDLNLKAKD